jgi:phosphate uptake regulator
MRRAATGGGGPLGLEGGDGDVEEASAQGGHETLSEAPRMTGRRRRRGAGLEIRKLQKVGSSTLSVSLPSQWAASQGLKRGASVQLVEDGRELRVIPVADGAPTPIEDASYLIAADECKNTEVLARVIVAGYVLGRDYFVVRARGRLTGEQLEAIRRTSKKLIGTGILEEGGTEVVLQCSIDTARYPIDALFKRLYNLSSSALTDSVEALRTKDTKLAEVAASREEDADMIYWLIMRLILSAQQDESVRSLIGLKSRADVSGYSIIATDLERISDNVKIIADTTSWLLENKVKVSGSFQTDFRSHTLRVLQVFQDAMLALVSRELDRSVEAAELAAKLRHEEPALMTAAMAERADDPETQMRIARMVQALTLVADAARAISVIAFSRHQHEATRFMRPSGRK